MKAINETRPCGYCKEPMANPRAGKKYCSRVCGNRAYLINNPYMRVKPRPRKTAQTFLEAWSLWSPAQKLMQSALSSYPMHRMLGR